LQTNDQKHLENSEIGLENSLIFSSTRVGTLSWERFIGGRAWGVVGEGAKIKIKCCSQLASSVVNELYFRKCYAWLQYMTPVSTGVRVGGPKCMVPPNLLIGRGGLCPRPLPLLRRLW